MKTYFTFENLYTTYVDCRHNKAMTANHLQFRQNLEKNLLELEQELCERTYRPGRSIAFVVRRPKVREIFAADFRDRVVHHLLFNYMNPVFERQFIYDSWACRKGKGTHRAVRRLEQFMYDASRTGGGDYYLQMDIKSFFTSIDKRVLYELILAKIKNPEILWLTRTILFHDCVRDVPPKMQSRPELFALLPSDKSLFAVQPGKGLPIGNLTSQFFANVYLNRLDQFVKHTLKVQRYSRYVDDFVLIGYTAERLMAYRDAISAYVAQTLLLTVHPRKTIINLVGGGINFIGYVVFPDHTLVRRRVAGNWRLALDAEQQVQRQQAYASYLAHSRWANARGLEAKMLMRV